MTLIGAEGLQRRLAAIRSERGQRAMMGMLGAEVVSRAKSEVARKTGNLGRTIVVGRVTDDSVTVEARAAYAAAVEKGTRAHDIRPRRARALRFAATSGGARLSGSARRGAAVVFARYVHHPGTRPQPYLEPAARTTLRDSGIVIESVTARWNAAD